LSILNAVRLIVMSSSSKPPSDGDTNRGPGLVVAVVLPFVAASIAVTLRLYTRLRVMRAHLGWDDYTIIGALVGPFHSHNLLLYLT